MAVAHNRLRRRVCSLVWESHAYRPPRCRFIPSKIKTGEPCVCAASTIAMWLSLLCFLAGGLLVLVGGLSVHPHLEPDPVACWQLRAVDGNAYKVNQCTGALERVDLIDRHLLSR
jgi:hypothetical protein